MSGSNPLAPVIDACLSDDSDSALSRAVADQDFVAAVLVSLFDSPTQARFDLLISQPSGPTCITDLAIRAANDPDALGDLTGRVLGSLPSVGPQLSLTQDQARALADSYADDGLDLDAEHSANVLRWVGLHHSSVAANIARKSLESAPVGPLDEFDEECSRQLGVSDRSTDHVALLAYARRNLEANHISQHDEIISTLDSLSNQDLNQLVDQLAVMANRGLSVVRGSRIVDALTPDQVRALCLAAQSGEISNPWFDANVLPLLFDANPDFIVSEIGEPWLSDSSRLWVLRSAPWSESTDSLTIKVLRALRAHRDPLWAASAQMLIRLRVESVDGDHPTKSSMPRIGVRALLGEGLAGRMPPNDPNLVVALNHLDADLRLDEYRAANWAQPARARRMAEIVGSVAIEDVVELIDLVFALATTARVGFLTTICDLVDADSATLLVDRAGDDEASLSALSGSGEAVEIIYSRWVSEQHLPSFRALSESRYDQERLNSVGDLVSNYESGRRVRVLEELLGAMGETEERYELLLRVVRSWDNHPAPKDALLVAALNLAGNHVVDGWESDNLVEAATPLCVGHSSLVVRKAAYAALAMSRPTAALIDLLEERIRNETTAGQSAVSGAVDAITAKLMADAEGDNPHDASVAVEMLEKLRPNDALPLARELAMTAPSAEDRIRAIRIIADHGDRGSDPSLLHSPRGRQ